MPTWVTAAILGIVQGLTEFLPVSSTAHLLVLERLLGFDDPASVFTEMIQLGSILAIVWLYRAKVLDVLTGLPTRAARGQIGKYALVARSVHDAEAAAQATREGADFVLANVPSGS